jgi:hypothetical protein
MNSAVQSKRYWIQAACVAVLCFPLVALAQVLNIEDPTTPLDSLRKNDLKWGLSLSGNLSMQSIMVYDYGVIAEAVFHRNDKHQLLLNGKYLNTGTSDGVLINSGYYYVRFTPHFHKRIAPQFFLQQQIDAGRGLLMRNLAGANLRFDAYRGESFCLQLSTGAMQEEERWNISGSPDAMLGAIKQSTLKSNNVLRMTSNLGEHVELSFINFFQMPFSSDRFSFRWAAQLNVSVKFNSWLALQLNYQSMYDTNPVVTIPSYYYTSTTGIGFSNHN